MSNIVAIVGRPNVGKSTLFNRLVEERDAITHDESGVTRDRHYGKSIWNGKVFTVIDTGGYVADGRDTFDAGIREQVEMALEEASVILFVLDVETGLSSMDTDFAKVLRQTKKPVFIVANKADTHERALMSAEFYSLGMGEVYSVSAVNGMGSGELLDAVCEYLEEEVQQESDIPRISVVGRPNAGKSSFVNTLLNQTRSIVNEMAGTTRDSVDTLYKYFGKEFILTDTAGIRRKSKVQENVEFYAVLRALRAIEQSDTCVVMIDATRGMESQDLSIIHHAQKFKKGLLIMVNKWDLVEKDEKTALEYEKAIKARLAPYDYIPVMFCSVLTKQRIFKAIELAVQICEDRKRKVPTSVLNEVLLPEIERTPPPSYRGHLIRIKYITQLQARTPAFAFFCNHPKHVKLPYQRFLENRIRDHFGFQGVPISIVLKKK